MGYYDTAINTQLERLGANTYTTLELEYGDYDYYDMIVMRAPDGYYISTDSGCSCYSPFESLTEEELIGPITKEAVLEEFESLRRKPAENLEPGKYDWTADRVLSDEDVALSIAKIEAL